MLCPGAIFKGKLGPLTEYPLPLVSRPQRVNSPGRMLVNTTGNVDVLPTATAPNDRVEGLAIAASRVVPVPSTGSSNFVFDPTSVNATFAPFHPIVLGVKVTLRLRLCPGLRTSGR